MKKNEIDLASPQRQSGWAVIFIILRFLKSFIRQAWVLLIPLVLGRNSANSEWDIWEIAIAGLGLFSAIWSIIAYFRYYFNLSAEEFIIQQGILSKSKINIPYERIQSVNFRQSFLHQLLNVTEVTIDTAGSGEKEIQIDALSIENAHVLRKEIFERKKEKFVSAHEEEADNSESHEVILNLSNSNLLKVGLAQNHLKPVGLVIGFIFSIWAYSWQFETDINPVDVFRNIYAFLEELPILQLIFLAGLFVIFSVAYSVITTFLNHANLSFMRMSEKFQLIQGLFTRKEVAALDRKIQFISWGQNILEKKLGFFNLSFEQAGSRSFRNRANNFSIPGCSSNKIKYVQKTWLGKNSILDATEAVSIHMFYYNLRYILAFFFIILIPLAWIKAFIPIILFSILCLYSILTNWLKFKKKRFYFDANELYISGGGLGLKFSLMPTYKVQNLSIRQTPYQWRRKLATLYIYTAAGALIIPFIKEKRAKELLNFFLYKVETSSRPWM